MDFVTKLPSVQGYDTMWVIVEDTKSAVLHTNVRGTDPLDILATMDTLKEVVRGMDNRLNHFDRGPEIRIQIWRALQNALGNNLDMSMVPSTDAGNSEWTFKLSRNAACLCNDFGKGWIEELESAYKLELPEEVAFDLLRDALSAVFGLSELKEINRHGMPRMHWVIFWIARLKI
ncbi:hypothetical protein Tco_0103859 [Tanacetum coccineum]